jgi:hypothetical protein
LSRFVTPSGRSLGIKISIANTRSGYKTSTLAHSCQRETNVS